MKKLFKISALCAATFALVLTGCKTPEPKDPVYDGVTLAKADGEYLTGEQLGGVPFNWFSLEFTTTEGLLAEDGFPSGEAGKYVSISLFTANNSGANLPEGKFEVSDVVEAEKVFGTDDSEDPNYAIGSYWADVKSAEDYDIFDFVSGDVTISKTDKGYLIDMVITDSEGTTHKFRYEGAIEIIPYEEPGLYDDEPDASTFSMDLNTVVWSDNYDDFYGAGGDNIDLAVANEDYSNVARLDFITDGTGLTSIPEGTYQINSTFAVNTCTAYVEETAALLAGSWVMKDGAQYYLISGTVTVTGTGFTATVQSARGSSITINYTGSLDVLEEEGASAAPARIAKKGLAKKEFKGLSLKGNKKFSFKK
ncbi:MAG: hypothetical protein LBS50_00620 [Prevotellaceae bacterium]|jgi:hypothetical protein|nr:hypothetical protein [Prevotellaceae bacterium]